MICDCECVVVKDFVNGCFAGITRAWNETSGVELSVYVDIATGLHSTPRSRHITVKLGKSG